MLLLDIGNSRLKWAEVREGQLHFGAAIAHGGDAAACIAGLPPLRVDAVWVAQVLGPAQEAALIVAVQARWGVTPRLARSSARLGTLINAYAEPQRLGVDRWLALLALHREAPGAFAVASAGTALTLDRVADGGQHLGGIIAPGLHTAQQATLGATRFATRDLASAYTDGLGRDTEAAVRQGALLACVGALERGCAGLPEGARRVLTGGDAATLLPLLPGWQHRPHLVLEGLLAMTHATA
jgi:type III pantothenate kinase